MGVEYYRCEHCCTCFYEDYVNDIEVEGYGPVTLCHGCRDENMDMTPNEFVDIDGFPFEAREESSGNTPLQTPKTPKTVSFDTFYGLQAFVLGEPDDGMEPHYGWRFGVFTGDTPMTYIAATKEEAESAIEDLDRKCRQIAWEKLPWKGEDNTVFRPKRKWLETKYESVTNEIEDLRAKKHRLLEMLGQ